MMTPPEETGELSNKGFAVSGAPGDDDCAIVTDAVVSCNILERARGRYSKSLVRGGTKHLRGFGRKVVVLEEGGEGSRWKE